MQLHLARPLSFSPARLFAGLVVFSLVVLTSGCMSALGQLPRGLSTVRGELHSSDPERLISELGPVVVYLERKPEVVHWPTLLARTLYDVKEGSFDHDLVVLVQDAAVRFASKSGLEHRLFAIHGRDRIDVAIPAHGRSRRVRLGRQGRTRFYCSLHHAETWDAFVAPSPLFARLDSEGAYRIVRVPPGDYTLRVWSAELDGVVGRLQVGVATETRQTIWLDPAKISP